MIPTLTAASLSGSNEIQVKGLSNSRVRHMMEIMILRNCPKRVLASVGTSLWVLWFDSKFNKYKQNSKWHLRIGVSCLLLWICSAQTLVGLFFSSHYCFLLCWKERGWRSALPNCPAEQTRWPWQFLECCWWPGCQGWWSWPAFPWLLVTAERKGKGGTSFMRVIYGLGAVLGVSPPWQWSLRSALIFLSREAGPGRPDHLSELRQWGKSRVSIKILVLVRPKPWLSIRWGPGSISPVVSGLDMGSFSRVGVI